MTCSEPGCNSLAETGSEFCSVHKLKRIEPRHYPKEFWKELVDLGLDLQKALCAIPRAELNNAREDHQLINLAVQHGASVSVELLQQLSAREGNEWWRRDMDRLLRTGVKVKVHPELQSEATWVPRGF